MKKVIITNLSGEEVLSIDCDEYKYGDENDYDDEGQQEMFLYKKNKIQAVFPYRKFIIQFIYE